VAAFDSSESESVTATPSISLLVISLFLFACSLLDVSSSSSIRATFSENMSDLYTSLQVSPRNKRCPPELDNNTVTPKKLRTAFVSLSSHSFFALTTNFCLCQATYTASHCISEKHQIYHDPPPRPSLTSPHHPNWAPTRSFPCPSYLCRVSLLRHWPCSQCTEPLFTDCLHWTHHPIQHR